MNSLDWPRLIEQAKQASSKAYAPYSHFSVGAACIDIHGHISIGCNVENASYGLTICAERNCIAHSVVYSGAKITGLAIYTHQEKITPPCGACRQVIVEFLSQNATVMSANHLGDQKQWTVEELLPNAFLPSDLLDKN